MNVVSLATLLENAVLVEVEDVEAVVLGTVEAPAMVEGLLCWSSFSFYCLVNLVISISDVSNRPFNFLLIICG